MSKPENKKSLLHKINDVFEDYVVSKLGDADVLETVENSPENPLGSDFNGSDGVCYAANRLSQGAQCVATAMEDIAEESIGRMAIPLPEEGAVLPVANAGNIPEEGAVLPAVNVGNIPEEGAVPPAVNIGNIPKEGVVPPAVNVGSVAEESVVPTAVNAGSMPKENASVAVEFAGRTQQAAEAFVKGRKLNTQEKSVLRSDSSLSAVRQAEGVTEARLSVPESSQAPQEAICRCGQRNACPDDFDALWGEFACLRAGFTELMMIAHNEDVGILRQMQQRIRDMQMVLQAIAERNGYTPSEEQCECDPPREYGYALRIMRARVLKLYDCIMGIVLRSKADYDMVALCMTLMRIANALRELN